jgi:hypothetical protein
MREGGLYIIREADYVYEWRMSRLKFGFGGRRVECLGYDEGY